MRRLLRTVTAIVAALPRAMTRSLFTLPPRGGSRLTHLRTSEAGGIAMELLCGLVTAPDTTQTALTMNTGNSATIRPAAQNSAAWLLSTWVDTQLRGIWRIRSPLLHDSAQGIRHDHIASEVQPLHDPMFAPRLYPQDPLTLDLSGSAVGADIESAALLVYYDDLPGVSAKFASPADVKSRMETIVTVENSLATGTAGNYSGEENLASDFDLLKANREYALLGYTVSPVAAQTVGECLAVRWRGDATGNLGVGGPGTDTDRWLTSRWFVWLSERFGKPCIPVFNSASRAGILIDAHQDENGLDVLVTSIFALLK